MTEEKRTGKAGAAAKAAVIAALSILIDYAGRTLAMRFSLPLWLDSFGVLLTAVAVGPVSGAVVGFTQNALFSNLLPTSFIYGIVSVMIGISAGIYARKDGFRTFFSSAAYASFLSLFAAVVSAIIDLAAYGGQVDNIWGNAVTNFLENHGSSVVLSVFIGELYLEFADKMITVILFYLILRLYRNVNQNRGKKQDLHINTGGMCLTILAAASLIASSLAASAGSCVVSAATQENTSSVGFDTYMRTVYDASNGLLPGHATDVASTFDGVMWVGTYAGLYRYNGSEFTFQNIPEIKNVNCLLTDREGRLWVGTNDKGIVLLVDGTVSDTADTSGGLCSDSIRNIAETDDGLYYVGTSSYLEVLELSDGISQKNTVEEVSFTKDLAAGSDGYAAAAGNDGVLYILKDGKLVRKMEHADGGFTSVSFGRDGKLYAGTEQGTVIRYSMSGGIPSEETHWDLGNERIINEVDVLDEENMMILTDQGAYRIADGQAVPVDTGEFTHSLQSMTVDYQGNIWIASSRDGLLKISDSAFTNLFELCGAEGALTNAVISWNGSLYAGTDTGLVILDEEKRTQVKNELTEDLDGIRIRYFAEDDDGNLYIATYGKGLVKADSSGTITFLSESGESGDRARTVYKMNDGTVVFSDEQGIGFIRNGKTDERLEFGDEIGYAAALCFMETDEGLYAGTDGNGLLLIKDGKVAAHYTKSDGLTSEVILKIVDLGTDGAYLLVTSSSLLVLKDGTITECTSFPYSNNYDALYAGGHLYVTGSSGIYVTSREAVLDNEAAGAFYVGPSNGFDTSLTVNSQNLISGATLLLSAADGVICLDTEKLMNPDLTVRLNIRSVTEDGTEVRAEDGYVPSVPADVQELTFETEVLNYASWSPTPCCRLKGYEEDWHEIGNETGNTISYTNVPAGDYTFELALMDPDSGSVLEENSLDFTVEESFVNTGRFYFYFFFEMAVFAAWFTWFITRSFARRREEAARLEIEQAGKQIEMGNKAVLSIARSLYARDRATGVHSRKVAFYSEKLARAYGFSDDECENIQKAAMLHDIGKVAIPDAVLNKPGRLTDEEYALMKTHTTVGAEILSGFTLIPHVSEGAKYHHERYDGKGYPEGIAGEEIPLYGRIIAVADAYDAMTSNRVYRKKQDMSYVLSEMKKGRGTQFDPELDDLFLELMEKGEVDPERAAELFDNDETFLKEDLL